MSDAMDAIVDRVALHAWMTCMVDMDEIGKMDEEDKVDAMDAMAGCHI